MHCMHLGSLQTKEHFVVLRGDFVASEPKIAPYMHDLGVARFTVQ